jgi:alkylation response protein AidB-like acyl-CoA dehydrogenase
MNYDLNKTQTILKDEAHRFLAKECPSDFVREMAEEQTGYSKELWQKMAELDWMGVLIPEQYDGMGGNFLDLTVLLSEMGYSCLPGPFFSCVVLGGLTILEAGSDSQKADVLPALSRGEQILSLAWVEQDGTYVPGGIKLAANLNGDEYILNGTKLFVPYAHVADTFICVARTGQTLEDKNAGFTLFLVNAKQQGIHIETLITMAGDRQCEVIFEDVHVSKDNILGQLDQGWPVLKKVLQMSAVAKCAEMIGGAQRTMDMAIPYVKGREQFGRPVGAFQAIQHHCANMLTYADTIKFMTYQAAWRISEGLPFEKEASMCKAWGSESYRKLVALAHQVIGGMGFMEEYDLQLYFKQAKAAEQILGDADFHRELVAQEIGL